MCSIISRILFKVGYIFKCTHTLWKYIDILRDRLYSGYISSKVKSEGYISVNYPVYFTGKQIFLGGKSHIRNFSRISCINHYGDNDYQPEITIGENANIGINNHIGCINQIKIGKNFSSGANCLITDHSHGENKTYHEILIATIKRRLFSKGPVLIGDNVHLGENVIVLPGITIGDNVVVGAGSVVTKNIPSNSIAVGNPAVVKRIIQK